MIARVLRLLPALLGARHLDFAEVRSGQARTLGITIDGSAPVHLDGEPWTAAGTGMQRWDIEVQPRALRVVI
ncbi:MAG: hypothetical protein IT495_16470 [Gammaproteobacteria bacterium]|nr:hypothetical protein [Gammaproteobacteria bacterium]